MLLLQPELIMAAMQCLGQPELQGWHAQSNTLRKLESQSISEHLRASQCEREFVSIQELLQWAVRLVQRPERSLLCHSSLVVRRAIIFSGWHQASQPTNHVRRYVASAMVYAFYFGFEFSVSNELHSPKDFSVPGLLRLLSCQV